VYGCPVQNRRRLASIHTFSVVKAQNTVLSDQQTLVTLQIKTMVLAASLVEALGGGSDRSQLPTLHKFSEKPSPSDYKLEE
jgi:outer membrane protein TolC